MRGAPAGWHSITPRLIATNPEALVAFLRRAFEATGDVNAGRPTELRIGDSIVMVSATFEGRGPTEAFLYLYVEDADATYARALSAGAQSLEAPAETPYGDRRATVRDPSGNVWQIATRVQSQGF
jgi:PhnB protein